MSFLLQRAALRGLWAMAFWLAGASPALCADDKVRPVFDPRLGSAFVGVSGHARKLLEKASCGKVFEEFRDSRSGLPLSARLSESGTSAAEHFSSLRFRDGTGTALCRQANVQAHTTIGGSTVFVCPAQLFALAERDRLAASAILVHETLHTLGLGENPPLPSEITRRIVNECGW